MTNDNDARGVLTTSDVEHMLNALSETGYDTLFRADTDDLVALCEMAVKKFVTPSLPAGDGLTHALMELYKQVKAANEETDLNPLFVHEVETITRLVDGDLFTPAIPRQPGEMGAGNEQHLREIVRAAIALDNHSEIETCQAYARQVLTDAEAVNLDMPEQFCSGYKSAIQEIRSRLALDGWYDAVRVKADKHEDVYAKGTDQVEFAQRLGKSASAQQDERRHAAPPNGWVMVPVSPTEEMLRAPDIGKLLPASGGETQKRWDRREREWAAMLSSLPAAPGSEPIKTSAQQDAREARPVKITDDHFSLLAMLQISSCHCGSKTPDAKYHESACQYRLACEIEDYLKAQQVQADAGAVAYIPDDALARLTPPLLVLDGVRLYRYNGVGTTALYTRPAAESDKRVEMTDSQIEQIAVQNGLNIRAYKSTDKSIFIGAMRAVIESAMSREQSGGDRG